MTISIENDNAVRSLLHQANTNIRELTAGLYGYSKGNRQLNEVEAFDSVLEDAIREQESKRRKGPGFSVSIPEHSVSYIASRTLDEQLHAMTKVKVAALQADIDHAQSEYSSDMNVSVAGSVLCDQNTVKDLTEQVKGEFLSQSVQAVMAQSCRSAASVLALLR